MHQARERNSREVEGNGKTVEAQEPRPEPLTNFKTIWKTGEKEKKRKDTQEADGGETSGYLGVPRHTHTSPLLGAPSTLTFAIPGTAATG